MSATWQIVNRINTSVVLNYSIVCHFQTCFSFQIQSAYFSRPFYDDILMLFCPVLSLSISEYYTQPTSKIKDAVNIFYNSFNKSSIIINSLFTIFLAKKESGENKSTFEIQTTPEKNNNVKRRNDKQSRLTILSPAAWFICAAVLPSLHLFFQDPIIWDWDMYKFYNLLFRFSIK